MHTASEPIKPLPAQKELRSLEGEWVVGAHVVRGPQSNGRGGDEGGEGVEQGGWERKRGNESVGSGDAYYTGGGTCFFAVTTLPTFGSSNFWRWRESPLSSLSAFWNDEMRLLIGWLLVLSVALPALPPAGALATWLRAAGRSSLSPQPAQELSG